MRNDDCYEKISVNPINNNQKDLNPSTSLNQYSLFIKSLAFWILKHARRLFLVLSSKLQRYINDHGESKNVQALEANDSEVFTNRINYNLTFKYRLFVIVTIFFQSLLEYQIKTWNEIALQARLNIVNTFESYNRKDLPLYPCDSQQIYGSPTDISIAEISIDLSTDDQVSSIGTSDWNPAEQDDILDTLTDQKFNMIGVQLGSNRRYVRSSTMNDRQRQSRSSNLKTSDTNTNNIASDLYHLDLNHPNNDMSCATKTDLKISKNNKRINVASDINYDPNHRRLQMGFRSRTVDLPTSEMSCLIPSYCQSNHVRSAGHLIEPAINSSRHIQCVSDNPIRIHSSYQPINIASNYDIDQTWFRDVSPDYYHNASYGNTYCPFVSGFGSSGYEQQSIHNPYNINLSNQNIGYRTHDYSNAYHSENQLISGHHDNKLQYKYQLDNDHNHNHNLNLNHYNNQSIHLNCVAGPSNLTRNHNSSPTIEVVQKEPIKPTPFLGSLYRTAESNEYSVRDENIHEASQTDKRNQTNDSDNLINSFLQKSPKSTNGETSNTMPKTRRSPMSPMKISLAGAKRRLGFRKKGLTQISVHRSEEVITDAARYLFYRSTIQSSRSDSGNESPSTFWAQKVDSSFQGENNSVISNNPSPKLKRMSSSIESQDFGVGGGESFIEGLGEGQVVSRQALVSPQLGDIQLSLCNQRGMLEVEVIRARHLHRKATAIHILPNPYVKVYLMKGKICVAKFKTNSANQTLDPLYQKRFVFRNITDTQNSILQVIVWGDYGRKDRKSLMGISQIRLDEVDLTKTLIGWYKLFNLPSISGNMLSSKSLRNRLLSLKYIEESSYSRESS